MNTATSHAFFDELTKIAALGDSAQDVDTATDSRSAVTSDKETPPPYQEHPAWTMAKGIGGVALGAGAGYAGATGLDAAIRALGGKGIPTPAIQIGAPLLGTATALGYHALQSRIKQQLQNGKPPLTEPTRGLNQDSEV